MTLVHQIIAVLVICLSLKALAASNSTLNLTSLSADCEYDCIPKSSFFTKRPKFTDCVDAIIKLPRIDGYGSFHNGPPDDPYRLPVRESLRTCVISVEMVHQGSSREAFDWFFLVQATVTLARECLNTRLSAVQYAGVWIWFGTHGRILVTVRHSNTFSGGGNIYNAKPIEAA